MADSVKALTHWRSRGREVRLEHTHTREVQTRAESIPPAVVEVMQRMASEIDDLKGRVREFDAVTRALTEWIARGDE